MKYIVLSFDDGRSDFYRNVLPILKKYRLPATLNVITNYIEQRESFITAEQILECFDYGVEIASHSADHSNDIEQIEKSIEVLSDTFKSNWSGGFASPHSEINKKNFHKYVKLLREEKLLYIRSGNQIKRDGYIHALLYILYKATKSTALFKLYNKRNVINLSGHKNKFTFFYPSVTCNSENSIKQVVSLIASMKDDCGLIVMFHSILKQTDKMRGGSLLAISPVLIISQELMEDVDCLILA